tara:strand:+ start:49 stop:246 length:198 start_codon:yes stop_codon:yes gene_type:complete
MKTYKNWRSFMIVCDGISPEDIKRIINSKILEEMIKDKAKQVYDEEKKKEQEEIIGNAKGKEGTI